MGSYRFERSSQEGDVGEGGNALSSDVHRALSELDWVENFNLQASDDGSAVVATVQFDPDWPDTANPDVVAEVFQRYALRIIDDPSAAAGKVSATDPLRASASVDDGGIDLFVFNED